MPSNMTNSPCAQRISGDPADLHIDWLSMPSRLVQRGGKLWFERHHAGTRFKTCSQSRNQATATDADQYRIRKADLGLEFKSDGAGACDLLCLVIGLNELSPRVFFPRKTCLQRLRIQRSSHHYPGS